MRLFFSSTLLCLLHIIALPLRSQGNLPESRQATFIEMVTGDEVRLKAKGVGGVSGLFGLKEEESVKRAENDARKAAVYFVVYGGAGLDGLIRSEEEKRKFGPVEQELFADANVQRFIAWEANAFDSRVKLAGGEKIRIEKQFRVSRAAIMQFLTDRKVLERMEDVADELGMPTLMALPEVKPGQNPLDQLRSDAVLKQAASTIESYLTQKRYNVVAPEQAAQLYEQQKAQLSIRGHEEDLSYMIALSVGSDIYVSYTVTVDTRKVGSSDVRKVSVSVRAYETTTARLLGTETGYSEESAAPAAALTEAAVTNALNNVIARLQAYWQEDLKNGSQYKIVFTLTGTFDEEAKYDIADAAAKTLKRIASRTKENVAADNTLDYLAWIQDREMQSPSALYRELRREFTANYPLAKLKQITLNRKLIVVGVE